MIRNLLALAAMTSVLQSQESRLVNPGNPSTIEDFRAGDASREPYQRATDLLAALQVLPGDWVADVGAGAGYYSMRLADLVGPEGRVFAEDISNSAVGWLNARVKVFQLQNVEVVKVEANDPKLPADRLEIVLVVDSYHHFTNYPAMLDKFLHALKPGGRLAVADYSFAGHRSQARADQLKLHEIDPALVRSEVEDAGFQVVRSDDPFVKWQPGVGNTRASATDLWLMIAIRPKCARGSLACNRHHQRLTAGPLFHFWHDRAVFHFLTVAEDQAAYVRKWATRDAPGGFVGSRGSYPLQHLGPGPV